MLNQNTGVQFAEVSSTTWTVMYAARTHSFSRLCTWYRLYMELTWYTHTHLYTYTRIQFHCLINKYIAFWLWDLDNVDIVTSFQNSKWIHQWLCLSLVADSAPWFGYPRQGSYLTPKNGQYVSDFMYSVICLTVTILLQLLISFQILHPCRPQVEGKGGLGTTVCKRVEFLFRNPS